MQSCATFPAGWCGIFEAHPQRLDLIADAAAAIEHSPCANRLDYLAALTVLVVIVGLAICFDQPVFVVSTLAWIIVFAATLIVVTPSGEQMTKMLAQVAAIRAGTKADAA